MGGGRGFRFASSNCGSLSTGPSLFDSPICILVISCSFIAHRSLLRTPIQGQNEHHRFASPFERFFSYVNPSLSLFTAISSILSLATITFSEILPHQSCSNREKASFTSALTVFRHFLTYLGVQQGSKLRKTNASSSVRPIVAHVAPSEVVEG